MIIFGTRGVTYSKDSSEFHCPTCATKSSYKHKRVRRFFTLYFIPVIPLDMLGEYVECQQCRGTYQLEVLDADAGAANAAFKAQFHIVMLRVMVMMMLADDVIEEEELEVIRKVYQQLTEQPLSEDEVMNEAGRVDADGRAIGVYLSAIVGNLNDTGKEMVIRSAVMVAMADGEFQDEEQQLIGEIGAALAMTPAHVGGVISEMTGAAATSA